VNLYLKHDIIIYFIYDIYNYVTVPPTNPPKQTPKPANSDAQSGLQIIPSAPRTEVPTIMPKALPFTSTLLSSANANSEKKKTVSV
jgi:hypothetical protein